MGTPTYIPLANVTLGGSDASIVFGSIPQNYSDLIVSLSGAPSDTSYPVIALRFNGDSANNYSYVGMAGNGTLSSAGSNASLGYCSIGQAYGAGSATSSRFSTTAQIHGYNNTDKHKTVLSRNNVPGNGVEAQASRWANTAAITSIEVLATSGGFATGTTIKLFGIVG